MSRAGIVPPGGRTRYKRERGLFSQSPGAVTSFRSQIPLFGFWEKLRGRKRSAINQKPARKDLDEEFNRLGP